MLAAERTYPRRMTAGNAHPTGPVQLWDRTSLTTTSAIASGCDGRGVSMRSRLDRNSPESRSTIAAFIPVPPMSIPNPSRSATATHRIAPDDNTQAVGRRASDHVSPFSTFGSRGSPRTCSATMLRWTANVPPPSVSAGWKR